MSEHPRRAVDAPLSSPRAVLTAVGLLLVLIAAVTVWVGKNAYRLATGETATVRTIERCREGIGTVPASACGSEWVFADGHTGHGQIKNPPVAVGDKIFAGDDWAYTSSGPLHRLVWLPGALLVLLVLGAIALGVGYRLDTRRARDGRTPTPAAGPPPPC